MTEGIKNIEVTAANAGERVDVFLADKTGITRSQVKKLIASQNVLINNRPVAGSHRTKAEEIISIKMHDKNIVEIVPEHLPVEILYKDDSLAVVDKPAGMVVYPAAGHSRGTLMNALAYKCGKLAAIGGPLRPGVVHRLDKDTSGVMVIALDDDAYYNLVEQFRQRTMHRRYIALICGNLKEDAGEISFPIGRSESDRKKMSTRTRRGKPAVTMWKVLKRFGCATLIEAHLETGRTHQIRVHFASLGYPVAGDRAYGRKTELEVRGKRIAIPRQMLHAETLGFNHPATGEYMEFSSQMPEDIKKILYIIS